MLTLVHGGERFVVLSLSDGASDVALDAITSLMGAGSLELLDDGDELLATLQLSDPAAPAALDGETVLNEIAPGIAVAEGTAASARIVGADGAEVMTCDVGDMSSNAVIRLNTVAIEAGKSVAITSFTLRMP
jgi:hypothetical protein